MSGKIRTFLALPVPEKYYSSITNLQLDLMADLEHLPHAISWSKKKRLHLTLFFLGYQFPEKINQLIAEMKKNNFASLDFELNFFCTQVQLFPSSKPKVIALTGDYFLELKRLREEISGCLKKVNIYPDVTHENQGFLPHITVGKVKEATDLKNQSVNMTIHFNEMVLFKSEQTAHTVIHTPLFTYSL